MDLRIVHITPFYYPVIGGVERVVQRICEYLALLNYDVYVVTYNRTRKGNTNTMPFIEEVNGVKVIRLHPNITYSYGTYSTELPKVLERLRADIVHVHVWRHPHVIQVSKLKSKLRFKAILHMHDPFYLVRQVGLKTYIYYHIMDKIFGKIIENYDLVITLTPQGKNLVESKFRCYVNTMIIPPGIDDELLKKAMHFNNSNREQFIVYIGRICREKCIDLLIRAMPYVYKEIGMKMPCVLIGPIDNRYYSKVAPLVRKLSVNAVFKGVVDEEIKFTYLSKAIAYVQPSLYEGFGISLLEAQAFGTPCIVTGYGGQLYAAPPRISSLWAYPDPESIAQCIIKLLTNYELWSDLSKQARLWASQHTWSRILPHYKTLYEALAS